jgi:transposase InsO family protein
MDFFTVPTLTGRVLFVLVLLTHHRRRILHVKITENPTAEWTAQQIMEAFPDDTAPRWLVRARDAIYSDVFRHRATAMGITEVVSAPSSPWQNPYAERLIGSLRRECLDHIIIVNQTHLRRMLARYISYYHGVNSSLPGEGRAHTTTRPRADGRARGGVRGGWWTTPSVRSDAQRDAVRHIVHGATVAGRDLPVTPTPEHAHPPPVRRQSSSLA